MSGRAQRIHDEVIAYGAQMGGPGQQAVVAGIYSFGIEVGLAIAAAAGGETASVLDELREVAYHGARDAWVAEEMDRTARSIVTGEAATPAAR